MIKVVHLSSAHDAADDRIFLKECVSLAAHGYDVTLVAPGATSKVINGVRILGVSRRSGRLQRMTRTVVDVLRAALKTKARICHFHDPDLIPIAAVLWLAGRKVIYDVHEDVPATIVVKTWIAPTFRRPLAKAMDTLERGSRRFVHHFVPATPSIARRFPRTATTVVQNFPLLREFVFTGGVPHRERPMNAAYIGGISRIRGIGEMLRAIGLLEDERARLVLAGNFSEPKLREVCEQQPEWRRVDFLGWCGRHELVTILGHARVGLVTLHPAPNHVESAPIKLFEYMAAGLPVIASNFTLWRDLVEREQCGLLVDPLDSDALASALRWVFSHPDQAEEMGRRGRAAVLERYNWDSEAKKLLELYARLAA